MGSCKEWDDPSSVLFDLWSFEPGQCFMYLNNEIKLKRRNFLVRKQAENKEV
jgi:hypothetical protein